MRKGGLEVELFERIARRGPIPFEEFHRAALYDAEYGYFAAGPLRSAQSGDFLTSPEVSPLFGETLARFVREERQRLGDPEGFALVEVGAGSGSLLAPLISVEPVRVWVVEVAPAARQALMGLAAAPAVVASLEELPVQITGVVIANELLDNQPVALAVRRGGGWEERWVGVEQGRLTLVGAPVRQEVASWCDSFAGPVPERGIVEVQLEAASWLRQALGRLVAGSVAMIDYGDTAEGLAPRRAEGTLRTYRSHHLGPDPLADPGATDITVDVNFTALVAAAETSGATVELMRQEEFLTRLGLRDRLGELRHRELALARSGDEMARLEVRSQRVAAETLLHPRGLGDFRVLVARKEPAPSV